MTNRYYSLREFSTIAKLAELSKKAGFDFIFNFNLGKFECKQIQINKTQSNLVNVDAEEFTDQVSLMRDFALTNDVPFNIRYFAGQNEANPTFSQFFDSSFTTKTPEQANPGRMRKFIEKLKSPTALKAYSLGAVGLMVISPMLSPIFALVKDYFSNDSDKVIDTKTSHETLEINDYIDINAEGNRQITDNTSTNLVEMLDSTPGRLFDHMIEKDGYLYISDSGLKILNISDPANIDIIGNYSSENSMEVILSGKTAYLFDKVDGDWGISKIDISDPTSPNLDQRKIISNDYLGLVRLSNDKLLVRNIYMNGESLILDNNLNEISSTTKNILNPNNNQNKLYEIEVLNTTQVRLHTIDSSLNRIASSNTVEKPESSIFISVNYIDNKLIFTTGSDYYTNQSSTSIFEEKDNKLNEISHVTDGPITLAIKNYLLTQYIDNEKQGVSSSLWSTKDSANTYKTKESLLGSILVEAISPESDIIIGFNNTHFITYRLNMPKTISPQDYTITKIDPIEPFTQGDLIGVFKYAFDQSIQVTPKAIDNTVHGVIKSNKLTNLQLNLETQNGQSIPFDIIPNEDGTYVTRVEAGEINLNFADLLTGTVGLGEILNSAVQQYGELEYTLSGYDKEGFYYQLKTGIHPITIEENIRDLQQNLGDSSYGVFYCPIYLQIVSPDGQRIGHFDGEDVTDMLNSFYSGKDSHPQFFFTPNENIQLASIAYDSGQVDGRVFAEKNNNFNSNSVSHTVTAGQKTSYDLPKAPDNNTNQINIMPIAIGAGIVGVGAAKLYSNRKKKASHKIDHNRHK